jgi:hypothetical protein
MKIKVGIPILKLTAKGGSGKHTGKLRNIACEALSERFTADEDFDRSLSVNNEYTGITSGEKFERFIKAEALAYSAKQKENGKRALRSDAVLGFALIVKPPAEWINGLTPQKRAKFFRDSDEIINDIMWAKNVISTVLHRDEQGEHKHYLGTVFTKDGRWCAKDIINLKLYSKFNREYPKRMQANGWHEIVECSAYDVEATKDMDEDELKAYKAKHIENKKDKKHGLSSKDFKAAKDAGKTKFDSLSPEEQAIIVKHRKEKADAEAERLEAERIAREAAETKRIADEQKAKKDAEIQAEIDRQRAEIIAHRKTPIGQLEFEINREDRWLAENEPRLEEYKKNDLFNYKYLKADIKERRAKREALQAELNKLLPPQEPEQPLSESVPVEAPTTVEQAIITDESQVKEVSVVDMAAEPEPTLPSTETSDSQPKSVSIASRFAETPEGAKVTQRIAQKVANIEAEQDADHEFGKY